MKAYRLALWILITCIVLLIIIRISIPLFIEQGITNWFADQQIVATVEDVKLNISDSNFSVTGLRARKNNNQVLNLDEFKTSWSWSGIWDSEIRVHSIEVTGLSFDVEQLADGNTIVAGIDVAALLKPIPESGNQTEAENKEPLTWNVSLDSLDLSNFNICYRQQNVLDYCAQFEHMKWQGNFNINLKKLEDPAIPLFAQGKVEVTQVSAHNNSLSRDLFSFDSLALHEIDIDTLNNISIGRASIEPLNLLTRVTDNLSPQVTRFGSITLSGLNLNQLEKLKVSEVTVVDHEALLIKQANKTLELNEWLPLEQSEHNPAPEQATSSFNYAVDKFIYTTDKSIKYQDNSLAQPFNVDLNNIEIAINNLDSSKPEQDSKIKYQAHYAEHGKITLEGVGRPLSKKPSFDLPGSITGLDLRDISAFTSETIGHSIKSGQLDAELSLKAANNVLDSTINLKLYHFELTALSQADKEKVDSSFGLPLNSSLSLLKDSDNTIQLSIPITGDLESPDFDASDAITKAISSAITSTIINYYTPFGLVIAVDGLFDLATALDFEPVEFSAGEHKQGKESRESLSKLAQLMTERPGIRLTLCSFTNSADRKLSLPETAEILADDLVLEATQLSKLTELGEARAAGVKQFLVQQNVDASRLVICTAEHREGDGLAGVEISI